MTQPSIYLDNAATSWPKPPSVAQAVTEYWSIGGTVGRSVGPQAEWLGQQTDQLRSQLAKLFGCSPGEVIFTLNATDSLNLIINGFFLGHGRRRLEQKPIPPSPVKVAVSSAEHNSVLRPLHYWQSLGLAEIVPLPTDPFGTVDVASVEEILEQDTPQLLCLSHASNVTGIVNDVAAVGALCRRHKTLFLLDAAQTAGCISVDVHKIQCDFLATAGHKGLLGPLGTGVMYLRDSQQDEIDSLRMGGTGTSSEDATPVSSSPEKWEAGNPNLPGLLGLLAAVSHVQELVEPQDTALNANQPVQILAARLWAGLQSLDDIHLVADPGHNPFAEEATQRRLPIVSCVSRTLDAQTLAMALQQSGVVTRAGYHCAPWAHRSLGTQQGGTLRLSLSSANTMEEIDYTVGTMRSILQFS